jgi:hypothetical protein
VPCAPPDEEAPEPPAELREALAALALDWAKVLHSNTPTSYLRPAWGGWVAAIDSGSLKVECAGTSAAGAVLLVARRVASEIERGDAWVEGLMCTERRRKMLVHLIGAMTTAASTARRYL